MSSDTGPLDVTNQTLSVVAFTEYLYANYSIDNAGIASDLHGYWREQIVCAALFGVLTVCTGTATVALLSKRSSSRPRLILLICLAVMYAATGIYVATEFFTFALQESEANNLASNLNSALECMHAVTQGDLLDDPYTCAVQYDTQWWIDSPLYDSQPCISTVSLNVNTMLGDAIVWWRTWAVWQHNPIVSAIGITLLLASLVMGLLYGANSCNNAVQAAIPYCPGPSGLVQCTPDQYSTAAAALSLFTNIVATCLIAYKAWSYRRGMREHFKFRNRSSQVEGALFMLFESGAVYCVVWTLACTFQATPATTEGGYKFNYALAPFFWGAVIPIIAIYPTVIILLVALNRSYCDSVVSCTVDNTSVVDRSMVFRDAPTSPLDTRREGEGISMVVLDDTKHRPPGLDTEVN